MNLGESLLMNAEKFPRKPAIIVDEEVRTYGQLNLRANQLAGRLLEMGVKKGDLVGILSPNSVTWVEALFAILKMGAVVVPANYRLLHDEILRELDRTPLAALFFTEEYGPVAASCLRRERLLLMEGEARKGISSLDSVLHDSTGREPVVDVRGDDLALILFTGGTTGLPKGAMHTHETTIWMTINYMIEYETPRTDHVMLHPYPLFHMSGLVRLISYIRAGATYVTMKSFDAEGCLRLIEQHGVTSFIGSSAVFVPMHKLKVEKPVDTSSVINCCATFAFMDNKGRERLRELFPNARVYESYGSTEGGPVSSLRPGQRPREAGSVGRPSIHTRMKIVDERGEALPPGEVGEIVVKGPHVAIGYYNDPEETKAALKNGWFHTGDMGKLDQEGFLYMVDRKKDMIKTGGENVYSREVEEILLRHPDIEEAAVIGVPHERWGEAIKAIVVRRKGTELSEQEVIDFCRQHMAGYKKPALVEFLESIPKTATGGKVSKWKLREKHGGTA